MASNLEAMASNLINTNGLHLQPRSDGLHPGLGYWLLLSFASSPDQGLPSACHHAGRRSSPVCHAQLLISEKMQRSVLLVAMPGAPSSVLAASSDAWSP